MKKLSTLSLTLIVATSLATIGSASWVIANSFIEQTSIGSDFNNINETDYYMLTIYEDENLSSYEQVEVDSDDRLSMYLGDDPDKEGYFFDGYYDTESRKPIDENQTINKHISIYKKYTEITPEMEEDIVSNVTSDTLTPGTDDSQETYYVTDGKIDANTTVDAKFDSTVDACNPENPVTPSTSDTTSFGTEDSAVSKIVLQTDLIIESGATFNLGAQVGYTSGTGPKIINGAISGDFTTIDLNGHNIIVRGTFNAYGLVTNSRIGKGMVYVDNGGKIVTPFCILDFLGGGNLVTNYNFAYAPFNQYVTPYLACTTIVEYGGELIGIGSLCAGSTNYPTEMRLIGSTSTYLLQMSGGYAIHCARDYSLISTDLNNFIPSLYREKLIFTNKLDLDEYILPESIEYNSAWDYSIIEMTTNSLKLSLDMGITTVDAILSYVEFGISSYLDLEFYSTKVNLTQSFEFFPYSTGYLDKNSTLNFRNNDIANVQGGLGTKDYCDTTLQYPGGTALGIRLGNQLKIKGHPGMVTIDGNISFETNTSTSNTEKYEIGGYVNLSTRALASLISAVNNGVGINVFESSVFSGNAGQRSFFSSKLTAIANVDSGKDTYYPHSALKYYNYPLISNDGENDIAYFTKDGKLLSGIYDPVTGLISIDDKKYSFVYTSTNFMTAGYMLKLTISTGTKPTPQNNIVNRINNVMGTWVECTYNSTTGIITANSKYYAYYNGAYIQVNSNSANTTFYSSGNLTMTYYTKKSFLSANTLTETVPNWKFAQICQNPSESTSLVFNSTTQTWSHG